MNAMTATPARACVLVALVAAIGGCARLATPAAAGRAEPTASPTLGTRMAQATPPPLVGDQGPAIALMPGLSRAQAPSWVRTGLRLTYKATTATIAGTGQDWHEDPDGGWVTEDGRRWSPGGKGGKAAEGFMQFDVTAASPSAVAILATFYLVASPGAPPKVAFQYPVIGYAGNTGGLWVHPDQLRAMPTTGRGDLKVVRMPYSIGGTARPGVWIQGTTEQGYVLYVYDEETGVLLHDATASKGRSSPVIGPDEVSNTPSTLLAQGTLVSQRVVAMPWLSASATAWSASAGASTFRGSSTVPTAGGAPLRLGHVLEVKPKARGAGWVYYGHALTTTNTMGMPPTTTPAETLSGLGQFGGAWLPPATLATLTSGQRLDRDQVTGFTVTVRQASSSAVRIEAVGGSQTLAWTYEPATGDLVAIEKSDPTPLGPIRTQLSRAN